jgi:hypothetical protein
VFWLKQDLKELDKISYAYTANYLYANGYQEPRIFYGTLKNQIWQQAALLKYKDFIRLELREILSLLKHDPLTDDSIGDARPWYEKPELPELLQQDQYQRDFSDQPLIWMYQPRSTSWKRSKSIRQQAYSGILAVPTDLMKVRYPTRYQANLQAIDGYMATSPLIMLIAGYGARQALYRSFILPVRGITKRRDYFAEWTGAEPAFLSPEFILIAVVVLALFYCFSSSGCW